MVFTSPDLQDLVCYTNVFLGLKTELGENREVNKYPLYVFCELIFSHLEMCPGLIVGTLQSNALKHNKR